MNKSLGDYTKRMGYMPCYKFPEEIDEDSEFMYYKFRVPRIYIRWHIEEGNIWPDYEESFEGGTRDESVVLGVGLFPVYSGVEYLDEDADFLYYKVKVPKAFLDTYIEGTTFKYGMLYETKDFKLKTPEQIAEEQAEIISTEKVPKAGEPMPDREDLIAVKKTKETDVLLYEVVFYCAECNDGEGKEHEPEVGSDLWEILHARKCGFCGNTKLHLKSCKSVLEEKKDE
jgi:hypothetical protein